jgi:large conductance mechanosensitive channel
VKGFKAFLMQGNLISLAVAVVIGTAFTAVVTALVTDLLTPLIAAIAGDHSFPNLTFTIHKSTFAYGLFINAALSFLIIASVVYWLVVAPTATLTARLARKAEATTKDCPECLSTIPIAASRCMYCTVELVTTSAAQAPPTFTPATFTPTAPPAQPPRSPGQPPRSSGRHSSGNY